MIGFFVIFLLPLLLFGGLAGLTGIVIGYGILGILALIGSAILKKKEGGNTGEPKTDDEIIEEWMEKYRKLKAEAGNLTDEEWAQKLSEINIDPRKEK